MLASDEFGLQKMVCMSKLSLRLLVFVEAASLQPANLYLSALLHG